MSLDTNCFKKIDTTIFENYQGINPMGISAPWADHKNKQLFKNMII